jgi:quercetin 2,3-dioxygenase
MLVVRPSEQRGHFDFGWLDTRHTFSFGEYFDPAHHQFRSLRVINEDRVQPGQGFGTHGHKDMEILTWVLEGVLEHKDSLGGGGGVLGPGEAQAMSAGTGIRHSEFNGSATVEVHFLQIWLLPEAGGLPPRYQQTAFEDAQLRNRLGLVASRDGAAGSVILHQDARVFVARLDPGRSVAHAFGEGRHGYVHLAKGAIDLNGQALKAGDGARLSQEPLATLTAHEPSEVLVFDLA